MFEFGMPQFSSTCSRAKNNKIAAMAFYFQIWNSWPNFYCVLVNTRSSPRFWFNINFDQLFRPVRYTVYGVARLNQVDMA